ncbi:MAG: hypothetical protein LBO20_00715 [Bifidobacteriaceae bacterium]|jgi:hypothetical protein|nr:hypothetical protein [Bifidobacteriaceae bacterium]
MELKNQYGKVALDLQSVKVKDGLLVVKGDALGSIPVAIHMSAADMWEARQYITWPVVRTVVTLFFRGRSQARKAARTARREGKP